MKVDTRSFLLSFSLQRMKWKTPAWIRLKLQSYTYWHYIMASLLSIFCTSLPLVLGDFYQPLCWHEPGYSIEGKCFILEIWTPNHFEAKAILLLPVFFVGFKSFQSLSHSPRCCTENDTPQIWDHLWLPLLLWAAWTVTAKGTRSAWIHGPVRQPCYTAVQNGFYN